MIMLLYGIEDIVERLIRKINKKNISRLSSNILIITLGIICLFLKRETDFVPLCIIWATWAILREEWEISEVIHEYKVLGVKIVNSYLSENYYLEQFRDCYKKICELRDNEDDDITEFKNFYQNN